MSVILFYLFPLILIYSALPIVLARRYNSFLIGILVFIFEFSLLILTVIPSYILIEKIDLENELRFFVLFVIPNIINPTIIIYLAYRFVKFRKIKNKRSSI